MVTPVPMSLEGKKKLEKELKHIKSVERPKNIRDIEEARAHGDLSENAEYHAAKERQSFLSARMGELEDKIARAQIVDTSKIDVSKVYFGATVKLLNMETGEEKKYKIVGPDETDVKIGKISIESPIAKSLMGRRCEDSVEVRTPKGLIEFEIQDIKYE